MFLCWSRNDPRQITKYNWCILELQNVLTFHVLEVNTFPILGCLDLPINVDL